MNGRGVGGSIGTGRTTGRPYGHRQRHVVRHLGRIGIKSDIILVEGVISAITQPTGDQSPFGIEIVAVKLITGFDGKPLGIGHDHLRDISVRNIIRHR